mmetsp:Transcript_62915/g.167272  ORF Transcript_62915/g.167272 Transcript_62915/m.167272 type:complete len:134 (+) Transcript_62915:90-491(+)
MPRFILAWINAALLFGCVCGHQLQSAQPGQIDNSACKTTCHRFGMQSLGEKFKGIDDPVKCCDVCDEVYPEGGAARKTGSSPSSVMQELKVAGMDQNKCKVACQRFGMRSLGPAFKGIKSPVTCVSKCEEVYQ